MSDSLTFCAHPHRLRRAGEAAGVGCSALLARLPASTPNAPLREGLDGRAQSRFTDFADSKTWATSGSSTTATALLPIREQSDSDGSSGARTLTRFDARHGRFEAAFRALLIVCRSCFVALRALLIRTLGARSVKDTSRRPWRCECPMTISLTCSAE